MSFAPDYLITDPVHQGNSKLLSNEGVRVYRSRLSEDDVHQYIRGVCFKNGPPGTVGAETEWFVVDVAAPGAHVPVRRLRTVMEAAAPPPNGSNITYEPGGQLELSSAPFPGLAPLHEGLS